MKEKTPLFLRTVAIVKAIPRGKVLAYGGVARLIGAPECARHVSFILASSSKKYGLPWHRVINSQGRISPHRASSRQKLLLQKEGVIFEGRTLDLTRYTWKPNKGVLRSLLKGIPRHLSIYER